MSANDVTNIVHAAPPSGEPQPTEQPTETSHVAATGHADELTELGARVAFELPAVFGTCRPEDVIAEASARTGMDVVSGRRALCAYSGWLDAVLRPVVLHSSHKALPNLDEVPA